MARQKLREVRRSYGLTQEEMAARIGVSLPHYKNIERGVFDPSYEVLERFSKAFPKVKNVWNTFQKEDKITCDGTKIDVKISASVEEVGVKTDWGN